MATPDGNEVYVNIRHAKKKTKQFWTVPKKLDGFQSHHNQAYNCFSGGDSFSSKTNEREKSVHEYITVDDLAECAGNPSKTKKDANLKTPPVIYENFSEVYKDRMANHHNDKNITGQLTSKQHSNSNICKFRHVLLIIVLALTVSALMSIISGFIVENIISKNLKDAKLAERNTIERLKTGADWSNWADWGRCSVSCDLGLRSRERMCLTQNITVKKAYCSGSSQQEQICLENPCAVGGWGNWSPWGSCSVTCGVGTRTRGRQCDNPTPSAVSAYCKGHSLDTDICLSQACKDGVWSAWLPWGPCSASCSGGVRLRVRNCAVPAPSILRKTCFGKDVDITACNKVKCKDPMVYFNAYRPKLVSGTVTFQTQYGSSSFNRSSGLFTCPVSGLYYFTVNFMVTSSSSPYCYIRCIIRGRRYDRGYARTGGSSYYWSASSGAYCQLSIGDQAYIYCVNVSSMYIHSSIAFFTGALITPS